MPAYWRDVLEQRDFDRALRLLRMTRNQAKRQAGREWDAAHALAHRVAEHLALEAEPTVEIEQLAAAAADEVHRTATIPIPRSIPPPPTGSIALKMARLPMPRALEPA